MGTGTDTVMDTGTDTGMDTARDTDMVMATDIIQMTRKHPTKTNHFFSGYLANLRSKLA